MVRLFSCHPPPALLTERVFRMTDTKSSSISSDVEKWGAVETRQEDIYVVDELEEKRCVRMFAVECVVDPDAFLKACEAYRHAFGTNVDVHLLALFPGPVEHCMCTQASQREL